jgi:4-amino-4-deoxy-L-arabinose transferase-like glycosyltransferase
MAEMIAVLVSLPLLAYVLFFYASRVWTRGWRDSAIRAATAWGVVVVLITELLTFPGWLTKAGLAFAWLVIDVAALIFLWQLVRSRGDQPHRKGAWNILCQWVLGLGGANVGLLGGVAIVLAVAGVVALLSPPNTWDVMAYHMPRVMHWIQNHGVAFYPTHELRQLHMAPWAEFAMLQLHLLVGDDTLNTLVQWFSLLASVVGITWLARSMGAGSRGQILAAVFCATIPQGLLQASGAKNDYVVAFWLVALTYYLLHFQRQPNLVSALGIGAALGLAWLTKGTAYIFSLGILTTWGLAWLWTASTVRKELALLGLAVFCAIVLNTGHYVRNYSLYGSPLGPGAEVPPATFKYTNDEISIPTLVSNIIRNLAIHLGTTSKAANEALEQGVTKVIQAFGGDVNDPRTTWDFTSFRVPRKSYHEDLAGNPLHLALIVIALGMMLSLKALRRSMGLVIYTGGLVLAFLLFCTVLKWQPWHTRLHLPLFVLWSPAIGVVMERRWPRPTTTILGILLLILSVPVILNNQLRPLAFDKEWNILHRDRTSLYFADRRNLLDSYRAAAASVTMGGCHDIGLDLPGNSYEYPLLRLLRAGKQEKDIRAVGVTNPSAIYADNKRSFRPCAIICLQCSPTTKKWGLYTEKVGPATIFNDIAVFSAQGGFMSTQEGDL